jgi:hypothetical protein
MRDQAIKAGFLPRILERLGSISGEKPRQIEIEESSEEEIDATEPTLEKEKSK